MANPLMSLLRASMQFADSLNDVGFQEAVQVHEPGGWSSPSQACDALQLHYD
jgi:hypothetical protein